MSGRVWLFVFKGTRRGQVSFTFYRDDPPTAQQLKTLPQVIRRWEITGTPWINRSLADIEAEYHRRVERGDLPPDYMGPPKARVKDDYKVKVGHREKPWTVGDLLPHYDRFKLKDET